jgi:hypothetical protein
MFWCVVAAQSAHPADPFQRGIINISSIMYVCMPAEWKKWIKSSIRISQWAMILHRHLRQFIIKLLTQYCTAERVDYYSPLHIVCKKTRIEAAFLASKSNNNGPCWMYNRKWEEEGENIYVCIWNMIAFPGFMFSLCDDTACVFDDTYCLFSPGTLILLFALSTMCILCVFLIEYIVYTVVVP